MWLPLSFSASLWLIAAFAVTASATPASHLDGREVEYPIEESSPIRAPIIPISYGVARPPLFRSDLAEFISDSESLTVVNESGPETGTESITEVETVVTTDSGTTSVGVTETVSEAETETVPVFGNVADLNAESATETETETTTEIEIFADDSRTESAADAFMQEIDKESGEWSNKMTITRWNYQSNLTDANKKIYLDFANKYGDYGKNRWNRVQEWKDVWPTFSNASLRRQFKLLSVVGTTALSSEKYKNFTTILAAMTETYSKAKICDYFNSTKCDLALEPELTELLKSSRNYDELTHIWKSWRDAAGKPNRQLFSELVKLSNEAAQLNGFPSTAEMWQHKYESETFEDDIQRLYDELRPIYEQLHAYVRRKLREVYGEAKIPKRGPIPAHVTGNMWAQSWANIYDILIPFPDRTSLDVTDAMKKQGYTPRVMFEKADDFFASMGLERVPELFWNNSIITKPPGVELVCHASAWDFNDGKDFRIKQCTNINMASFFTVHHELGHTQYQMQYKHLPQVFRAGANPGFHEAIGDVLSLSVSTPKHLSKVGLLEKKDLRKFVNKEADINFLLKNALDKIAFLPFGYMIDKYRWQVMRGEITPENYNKAWWDYRLRFQGISPPVERTEEDFDPAAKYHVSGNAPYMRYFIAHVLQFQFHNTTCVLAGEHEPANPAKPLHHCDIYQLQAAGKALKDMMRLGSSVHWTVALKALTGIEEVSAFALREYFRPLEEWLVANNEEHGEFIGWE